jgi:hypothetical protein
VALALIAALAAGCGGSTSKKPASGGTTSGGASTGGTSTGNGKGGWG